MSTLPRLVGLLLVTLAPCLLLADDKPNAKPRGAKAQIDAAVKELAPRIEAARGLKFKKPVVVKAIPRAKGERPGVQGYYDIQKKTVFVYDDIKDNYWRGTLVHEMVHALQDQHFGLRKLHATSFGSDRERALAALVEGDATYTMIEVLQKEQPHVAFMLKTPLEKARNLDNAFAYGIGAKYVKALKDKGGWKAVDMRYRFTPTSTAAILHPGELISPVQLGPGKSLGEFGLIQLLHGNEKTRPDSVKAAAGWRGDRVLDEGKASARVVAFATPQQAGRFFAALATLRVAEQPKWKATRDEKLAKQWESPSGATRSLFLRGKRVVEVEGPSEKEHRAMLDRIDGPPRFDVYSPGDKKVITFGELIDRLIEADMVCVGESHDSEIHHQVQLMIIKALYARDERLGVGMEMFQRPYQKALERYIAGATDEETFLEDSEYRTRWRFDWALYRPIVSFCKRNGLPLAALNVSDELRGRVSKVGYEKLTADEKKQLGEIDFHVKDHRAYWYDQLGAIHGQKELSNEAKERGYQVMTVWDEYMADSAARFQKERKIRRMVVLAGSGHIERGFGIPRRAAKRTGGKVLTVTTVLGGEVEKVKKDEGLADFVLIVR
jgi:uncharacterized iron-regulated protein